MSVTSWDPAGLAVVLGVYAWALLIVIRHMHVYMDLLFPAIATARPETGGGVEHAVSVRKRKVELS